MCNRLTVAVLIVSLLTVGCAMQDEMIKTRITMPGGEKRTLVHFNHKLPTVLRGRDSFTFSYLIAEESPTDQQLKATAVIWGHCRDHVDIVHPDRIVTVMVHGVLFGAAGAAGGALGALAFPTAIVGQYAQYGAASGGMFGLAYGATILTGELYTFQNCARDLFNEFTNYGIKVLLESPTP